MAAPNHHRKRNPKDTTVLEVQMPRLISLPCYCQGKDLAFLLSPGSMVPPPPFAGVGNCWVRHAAQRGQPEGLWLLEWLSLTAASWHLYHQTIPSMPIQLYSLPRKGSIHYFKPQPGSSLPPHHP